MIVEQGIQIHQTETLPPTAITHCATAVSSNIMPQHCSFVGNPAVCATVPQILARGYFLTSFMSLAQGRIKARVVAYSLKGDRVIGILLEVQFEGIVD